MRDEKGAQNLLQREATKRGTGHKKRERGNKRHAAQQGVVGGSWQRCPTPVPWLLYIFLDRGQDLERARSSAALNPRRVVHVFSADGPWATGGGLLRADFCRPASFLCVEGVQGCHCFSWELSLACRAPGTRAKCLHSKVLKRRANLVLVLVRGSTSDRLQLTSSAWS